MEQFSLSIITPEKKVFEGNVQEVFVPGQEGGMSILSRHAPLLAVLRKGTIVVKNNNSSQEFEIESGFIELNEKQATILAR